MWKLLSTELFSNEHKIIYDTANKYEQKESEQRIIPIL